MSEARHPLTSSEVLTNQVPTVEDDGPFQSGETAKQPGLVRIFPRALDRAPEVWAGKKRFLLGRAAGADIQLGDPSLSRSHAELTFVPREGLRVKDLGSRHGTFVDGRPAGEGALAGFGSIIRAGESIFMVVADARLYSAPPHRLSASLLGTRHDVLAGPVMEGIWEQATRMASLNHPVLILGESGAGKEAIARLIHAHGRPNSPFVSLNMAAIPEGLFESELFGHTRGSFTGAGTPRSGAFREASGGVLFLDEVADLQVDLQVKLLRAIDQMRVRPLGSSDDVPVDVRVVAATSQDVRTACAKGTFRLDLYYRLSGIVLHVPALRERRDDVLLLSRWLLNQEAPELELTAAAAEALALAPWPGNVRELNQALTHAMVQVSADNARQIRAEHLPVLRAPETNDHPATSLPAIKQALAETNGNASAAAKLLGISRATLYNVLRRQGVEPSAARSR